MLSTSFIKIFHCFTKICRCPVRTNFLTPPVTFVQFKTRCFVDFAPVSQLPDCNLNVSQKSQNQ